MQYRVLCSARFCCSPDLNGALGDHYSQFLAPPVCKTCPSLSMVLLEGHLLLGS